MTQTEKEAIRAMLKDGEMAIKTAAYIDRNVQLGILAGYRTAMRVVEQVLNASPEC